MNGKGGSYVIDPKSGEPVQVAGTGPSEDEQAREAANQAAREKETADNEARTKAEKAAAEKAGKESAAKALAAAKAAQAEAASPATDTTK